MWSSRPRRRRPRCALLSVALSVLGFSSPLAAHGPPPAALAILAEDARGPTFVRLHGGLARRERSDQFRYLCPAAWGDELALPAAAIPDGPIVVASARGLVVLDSEGRASPHSDPHAVGASSDFAELGASLFALRVADGATEVLAIDAMRVRTVFSEPGSWASIAATDDSLGLQRLNGERLEQLRITADGAVLDRSLARSPEGAYLVLARATARELYAVVATPRGRELGQIDAGAWRSLELTGAAIAGPIELPDGRALVALDGQLGPLSSPRDVLEGVPPVSCLGRLGAHAYACTRAGVSDLEDTRLADPIFSLSSLGPPDLDRVDEPQRAACQLQWEHVRFDLLAFGVALREPVEVEPELVDAGDSADAAADSGKARDRSGCGVGGAPGRGGALALFAALVALVRRRRRSAHQRQRAIQHAAKERLATRDAYEAQAEPRTW